MKFRNGKDIVSVISSNYTGWKIGFNGRNNLRLLTNYFIIFGHSYIKENFWPIFYNFPPSQSIYKTFLTIDFIAINMFPQGCMDALIQWLRQTADILFVLGYCVIAFLKLCFLGILRYEIKEMIQKIKLLQQEMAQSILNSEIAEQHLQQV